MPKPLSAVGEAGTAGMNYGGIKDESVMLLVFRDPEGAARLFPRQRFFELKQGTTVIPLPK